VTNERRDGDLALHASRRQWLAILAGCVVATFLNEQVSGANSWLPNTFGSAPDMATLLNARRRRIIDRLAY
jgi:hypothetical protein